jgi:O-antigen/teichoic acid export membrane protein
LIIIVPFLIAPYISRVLGPEGIGMQSYTTSKQSYFSMIAAMGTVTYGERLEEMIKESTVKSFF